MTMAKENELEADVASLQAKLGALVRRRSGIVAAREAELADAQEGVPGADETARQLEKDLKSLAAEETTHAAALNSASMKLATMRRDRLKAEKLTRQATALQSKADVMASAVELESAAHHLADLFAQFDMHVQTFVSSSESPEAQRVFSVQAIAELARGTLYNVFRRSSGAPAAHQHWTGSSVAGFHWFGWPCPDASILARARFSEEVQRKLDHLHSFFATQEEALAAQRRIDRTGGDETIIVNAPSGLWGVLSRAGRRGMARFAKTDKGA